MQLPDISKGQELAFLTGRVKVHRAKRCPEHNTRAERYLLLLEYEHETLDPFVVCFLDARGWQGKEWDRGGYFADWALAVREYNLREKYQDAQG